MRHYSRKSYFAVLLGILGLYVLSQAFQEWLNPRVIFGLMDAAVIC